LALAVPLSRFTPRVGGGSAFFVRQLRATLFMDKKPKTKAVREQTAKAKLRKLGLSRLFPKVRLKAGDIIECDFPVEKSK
jgi:hypothetical protein